MKLIRCFLVAVLVCVALVPSPAGAARAELAICNGGVFPIPGNGDIQLGGGFVQASITHVPNFTIGSFEDDFFFAGRGTNDQIYVAAARSFGPSIYFDGAWFQLGGPGSYVQPGVLSGVLVGGFSYIDVYVLGADFATVFKNRYTSDHWSGWWVYSINGFMPTGSLAHSASNSSKTLSLTRYGTGYKIGYLC